MNRPRILIIDNSVAVTGALKAVTQSATALNKVFSFLFIIPKANSVKNFIDKIGLKCIEWRMIELRKSLLSLVFYVPFLIINALRLKTFVKVNRIDLIHVNDLYNLLPALAAILGNKIPYVCHIRIMPEGFPAILFSFWLKLNLRYAERVIVVSESLLKKVPHHAKLVLIYDGIEFQDHHNCEPTENKSFLYLANIIPGKGHKYALEAFAKINKQLPDWKLRFVGGDMGLRKNREHIKELKDLTLKLGIAASVEWTGFVSDVSMEYLNADIVLNFSESESFSMTSLEALAHARPLIVSDCGGPAEIVTHSVSGILVRNKNVDDMAEAMLYLASSPGKRFELAERGYKEVKEKFDLMVTSMKLQAIYRECGQD